MPIHRHRTLWSLTLHTAEARLYVDVDRATFVSDRRATTINADAFALLIEGVVYLRALDSLAAESWDGTALGTAVAVESEARREGDPLTITATLTRIGEPATALSADDCEAAYLLAVDVRTSMTVRALSPRAHAPSARELLTGIELRAARGQLEGATVRAERAR